MSTKNSTEEKTILDKAEAMRQLFTTSTRDDGTKYVHLKGFAGKQYPQWMQDVCFAGHLDTMPDDHYYKAIEEVIDAICEMDADEEPDRDAILEHLNETIEADVYTSALTAWLNSDNGHVYYLTQAAEEYGTTDGFNMLMLAQKLWLDEIASAVVAALDEAEDNPDFIPEPQPES